MTKDLRYLEARERAVRYIGSNFSKAKEQIVIKLVKEGYERALAKQVASDLAEIDYCSDLRAAENLLRRHRGRKAKGDQYLRYLMRNKGIDDAAIDEALAALPDEAKRLRELVEASWSTLIAKGEAKARRFLSGRGFSSYLIERELESLFHA